ncbi:hypothetical protein ABT040_44905, partial [Streptomyces sp. NPDC002688]|uniref:hypothetical protein n=1 Tax=Streptomyces sp. NPDC002688 TaxID=3154423 RepID=UPI00331D503A
VCPFLRRLGLAQVRSPYPDLEVARLRQGSGPVAGGSEEVGVPFEAAQQLAFAALTPFAHGHLVGRSELGEA